MITCVADILAPEVAEATVHVLRFAGSTVSCNLSQTCCGQPAFNAGFVHQAAKVARPTLKALVEELDRGAEVIVVPAASCATMIRKFWVELFERVGDTEALAEAERVAGHTWELSELLDEYPQVLGELQLAAHTRVALHQSCHLLREPHVATGSAELLAAIAGCEVVEWEGSECCCGFGGTFSVKLPKTSVALVDDQLQGLKESDAEVVVGCDSSCLLHLRARAEAVGNPIEVAHLAEVLAAALPRRSVPSAAT
jgi:L-lactate dehydrogenase complex protein LldE